MIVIQRLMGSQDVVLDQYEFTKVLFYLTIIFLFSFDDLVILICLSDAILCLLCRLAFYQGFFTESF